MVNSLKNNIYYCDNNFLVKLYNFPRGEISRYFAPSQYNMDWI